MAQVSYILASKLVELINSANGKKDMHIHVLTTNQLALGKDPLHPTSVIDLSKEVVRSLTNGHAATKLVESKSIPEASTHKAYRASGNYLLEVQGRTIECRSLSGLLAEGLKAVEAHKKGTLDTLSGIQPRTKRIVARHPSSLFKQKDLVDKYSEKLMDGWYFGTNNSAGETKTWLKRGCEIAGLKWGVDFSTSI